MKFEEPIYIRLSPKYSVMEPLEGFEGFIGGNQETLGLTYTTKNLIIIMVENRLVKRYGKKNKIW